MKDVFEDGRVDVAMFQPIYLKESYKEGFNTTEHNAKIGKKHPGKFIYNTRWDPPDGKAGLEQLRQETSIATDPVAPRSTPPSGVMARGLESSPTRRHAATLRSARTSGLRTSTYTRARRIGRWTETPTCPTWIRQRPTSRS